MNSTVYYIIPWLHTPQAAPPLRCSSMREMGGAPRNPAPRNHFWCGLSNHQAATAQMHSVENIS